jgi:hypothetical protein
MSALDKQEANAKRALDGSCGAPDIEGVARGPRFDRIIFAKIQRSLLGKIPSSVPDVKNRGCASFRQNHRES